MCRIYKGIEILNLKEKLQIAGNYRIDVFKIHKEYALKISKDCCF